MRTKVSQQASARRLVLGLALLAALVAPRTAAGEEEVFAIALVTPGMNRTELTSVLGPPTYIQVKNLREAWQYCPPRSFRRFINDILGHETAPPLYVTVWFNEGRVEHMRAYPSRVMGQCEDFLAAFSWEDTIGGGAIGVVGEESYGGYRIK